MRPIILSIVFATAAFAQLESNVITITASREVNVPLDQANLLVSVEASLNTTLDEVVAAIQSTTITPANLTYAGPFGGTLFVSNGGVVANNLATQWTFTLGVPISSLTATLADLTATGSALPKAANPMTLSYYLEGAQSSPRALAANPCPYPAVFADAQAQAQKVAAAAGMRLGPVVAMTDGSQSLGDQPAAPAATVYVGIVGALGSLLSSPIVGSPSTCSLVVQFRLGG
jgi:Protein of unknown function (DUF541)